MKSPGIAYLLLLGTLLPIFPPDAIAQPAAPTQPFFLALKQAVVQRDTTALKRLVYPFRDEVEDMQAGMIENMLNGDPLQRGDGAFSMYALDSLIAHYLAEIKPVDDDLYARLATDRFFGPVIRTYQQKQVWVMDFHEVRMILLEKKGEFQLFFWENLNRLLRPTWK